MLCNAHRFLFAPLCGYALTCRYQHDLYFFDKELGIKAQFVAVRVLRTAPSHTSPVVPSQAVDFAPLALRKAAFEDVGGLDEGMSEKGICGIVGERFECEGQMGWMFSGESPFITAATYLLRRRLGAGDSLVDGRLAGESITQETFCLSSHRRGREEGKFHLAPPPTADHVHGPGGAEDRRLDVGGHAQARNRGEVLGATGEPSLWHV